ncbi:hypothetical protein R3W88_008073 [Solanum pinnatisectum]|uniref:RNase H type-1 domain-containing protein n=1 Tax=Solanum pinnatisectum TaxID=50273 RepID=A0AAV9MAQ9_9SOLN|nr:hypothetical protein R3W88_008073 [Solanum pinnatisectum]
MISGSWRIPWEIIEKVEDIQEIMQQINVHVWHIFREANQLANVIANTTINTKHKLVFQILNIDKQEVPSVRIKTRRIYNNNCQHA